MSRSIDIGLQEVFKHEDLPRQIGYRRLQVRTGRQKIKMALPLRRLSVMRLSKMNPMWRFRRITRIRRFRWRAGLANRRSFYRVGKE
jgi:hypothetical protein